MPFSTARLAPMKGFTTYSVGEGMGRQPQTLQECKLTSILEGNLEIATVVE